MKIPFNKPFFIGKEIEYIKKSVKTGHIAGDGLFTRKCHVLLEKKLNAKKVLLTTSCTSALEMTAILCGVKPGDEVILPSYTFVSTANAFYLRGAKPVFVDIRPDTLNIDESKINQAVTKRTKVIVPVHYAGVGCEMDRIMKIARDNGLYVVEDAAQGIDATYKKRRLGTIGDFGALSFHETKNCMCGEGGALIINNKKFIARAEVIREKGTDRSKYFRGEIDKYTWVDAGSSYLPSDILAAFLYAQLENLHKITRRRKEIYGFYYDKLFSLAQKGLLKLPNIPKHCGSNHHLFHIQLKDMKTRDDLLNYLKRKKIHAVFHYIPLHLSAVGRSMGYKKGQFPITEAVSDRSLRLPFYYGLNDIQQLKVVRSIRQFFKE
ncbi:MAG: dTDP-4-amino-4,6-dideoxygalactose transaminase [Candidatus Omnitrophota bacterium]